MKTVLILFRWQFPSSVRENVAFDCERPQRHKANGLFPFPFGSEYHSLNTISIMFRPLVPWTWNLAPAQWKIALHRHVLHSDVETQSCKMQHSKRARDNRESGGQQKPKTTYCPSRQLRCQWMWRSVVVALMAIPEGVRDTGFFFRSHYPIETLVHPLLLQRHHSSLWQRLHSPPWGCSRSVSSDCAVLSPFLRGLALTAVWKDCLPEQVLACCSWNGWVSVH